jgi:hypothetical protein
LEETTMTVSDRFRAYAAAVEECSADRRWDRLREHFTEQIVHERHVGVLYSFRHEGIDQVIAGFEESAEHIDRRFDRRILVPTGPITESGDQTRMPWVCLFVLDGTPACVDEGVEIATYEGTRISRLEGIYLDEVVQRIARWAKAHGHLVPGVAEYMARAR